MSETGRPSAVDTTPPINTAAIGVDLGLVILFAAIGFQTHAGELSLNGVASTAWPFLLALLVAHVLLISLRRSATHLLAGAIIVLVTVAGGMILRQLTGAGTATAFIAVAVLFNTTTLLGWRLVASFIARRKQLHPN